MHIYTIIKLYCKKVQLVEKDHGHVKEILALSFCYADVICHLRVKFHNVNQEDIFFSTFHVISWMVKFNLFIIVLNYLQAIFHFCTP